MLSLSAESKPMTYLKLSFGWDAYFGDKKKAFTEAAEAVEAIEAAFSLEQVREVQYLQSPGAPKWGFSRQAQSLYSFFTANRKTKVTPKDTSL